MAMIGVDTSRGDLLCVTFSYHPNSASSATVLARLEDRSQLELYIVTEQSEPQAMEAVVEKHLYISYFSIVRI